MIVKMKKIEELLILSTVLHLLKPILERENLFSLTV